MPLADISIYAFATIIGLVVGSFLNVVIHRGPALWGLVELDEPPRGNLASPRSYCPHCRVPIPSWRLIPIISYCLQGGRCANCGASISPRYLMVELAGAIHAFVSVAAFGVSAEALLAALLGWALIALAVIDLETGFLPDWLTFPLVLLGLSANSLALFAPFADALIGALSGAFVFWALGALWRYWRNVDALGLGDAKLLCALGAWMGWAALPVIVLVACFASLGVLVLLAAFGKDLSLKSATPFGPGLAFGGYLVFMGNALFP